MRSRLSFLSLFFFFISSSSKTFIVLVDHNAKPSPFPSQLLWYTSLISSSSMVDPSFIHTYKTLIPGFAATLTLHQSKRINNSYGVLSVFPDSVLRLQTTRSPTFLGLDAQYSTLLKISGEGSDAIVGVLDTGIWPERESFSDAGLDPVPPWWRGKCEEGNHFNRSICNRKLIGARFFSGGYQASSVGPINGTTEFHSPRDSDGHGTHVASIAAGGHVAGADFRGFARGTARGMAPKARLAIYKVCWSSGCLMSDIIAAIETAVSDGVDIISVSLSSSSLPFHLDPFAIVTFRAAESGVFVAISAGNGGPSPRSISNSPPWITTVGASTMDRDFPAFISLGNGLEIRGVSVTPETEQPLHHLPLVSLGRVISSPSPSYGYTVRGCIVLVHIHRDVSAFAVGAGLKTAGAAAMILSRDLLDPKGLIVESHVIPSVAVGVREATTIGDYITQDPNPTAAIESLGTEILTTPVGSPIAASFSSRGPNVGAPAILKPDLLAPGVNIVGAWTDAIGPSGISSDTRLSRFNIMSGTSMACPHVSGVAALLKSSRPGWDPSEIKSALMTTADRAVSDEQTGTLAVPYAIGAGLIRPERALDPGLVYDQDFSDYIGFLCGLNYTDKQIQIIRGEKVTCKKGMRKELNYPGFVVAEEIGFGGVAFERRLKKVGEGLGVYRAEVVGLSGFRVLVEPRVLRFGGEVGERKAFKVVLKVGGGRAKGTKVGVLEWRDEAGKHVVGTPIVLSFRKKLGRN